MTIEQRSRRHAVLAITIGLLLAAAQTSAATNISTRVETSASSGGNDQEQGLVTTGDRTVRVEVKSVVNGQSVEPLDLQLEPTGRDQEIIVQRETRADGTGAPVDVRTNVEVNGKPINLEQSLGAEGVLKTPQVAPESIQNDAAPRADEENVEQPRTFIETVVDWLRTTWNTLTELFS